jgi:N-acetylneuraminic acid mutarotase
MKRLFFIFLLSSILSLSFAFRESFGLRKSSPQKAHWTDSEVKGVWKLGESPDAGILSPGPQWGSRNSVPTSVAYHAAVAVEVFPGDWRVYIFGGYDGTNFLNTTFEYHVNGDSFSTKAPMPGGPRGRLAAAAVNGKIYVVGGTSDFYNALKRCEEYDPVADSWDTNKADMPTARQFLSAITWRDALIYAIGGDGGTGASTALSTVEMYDPVANTWTTADSLFTARRSHASGIINDDIFVAMGWTGEYLQSMEKGLVQDTNPSRIIWTEVENAPYGASRVAGTSYQGHFYITGGDSMGGGGDTTDLFTEKTYRYDPVTASWTMMPDKITAVSNSQAFVGIDPETLLLYPGGWSSTGVTNNNEGFPLAIHDAEADSIIAPLDSICIDSVISPKVIVENSGIVTESFDVSLLITYTNGGDIEYTDTLSIINLESDSSAVLIYPNWTVSVDTPYTVSLTTHLAIDGNPANDTITRDLTLKVRDVSPITILAPPDSIADSTYIPEVTVENFGCTPESFDVVFNIYFVDTTVGLAYSGTTQVISLSPSDSIITFPTWLVPAFPGTTYFFDVCTQLSMDARPGNDCISGSAVSALSSDIGENENRKISRNIRMWNAPNPARNSTMIHFTLPAKGKVSLKVYDLAGRPIRNLLEGDLKAEKYTVSWTGLDDTGKRVPSGVYFSRLEVGEERFIRKMILIQ